MGDDEIGHGLGSTPSYEALQREGLEIGEVTHIKIVCGSKDRHDGMKREISEIVLRRHDRER